jgi:hypothetical protein
MSELGSTVGQVASSRPLIRGPAPTWRANAVTAMLAPREREVKN